MLFRSARIHRELLQKQLALLSKLRSEAKSSRTAGRNGTSSNPTLDVKEVESDFKFVNERGDPEKDPAKEMARLEALKGFEDKEEEVHSFIALKISMSNLFIFIAIRLYPLFQTYSFI